MSRYCMEWFHFWLRDLNINRKFYFFKNTVVPYVSINVISRYNSTLIWIFWQPIMTIYHVPLYRIGWLYCKGFSRNLSRTGHKIKQSIYNTVTLPNKWYIYGKEIFHELFNWQWCMDKNRKEKKLYYNIWPMFLRQVKQ